MCFTVPPLGPSALMDAAAHLHPSTCKYCPAAEAAFSSVPTATALAVRNHMFIFPHISSDSFPLSVSPRSCIAGLRVGASPLNQQAALCSFLALPFVHIALQFTSDFMRGHTPGSSTGRRWSTECVPE